MKSFQISLLVLTCILCSRGFSQQIKVDGSTTPKDLIENHLIQGCVETSSISSPINGTKNGFSSFGYFERGSSNFPFENGIVLTTGKATAGGNVVNSDQLSDGNESWGSDPDLETALGITNTLNATAIEFEFASTSNLIQFNYILASEEYYGNNPCNYSDGFAFLIKRADSNEPYKNIALIPGTNTPVNTQTIRNGVAGKCGPSNAQYFDGYNLGDTNYNGRTKVMTATAGISPNVKYLIKMVIADQTDATYDSAVFIEGNSFNATVNLGEDITTCASSLTLNGNIQNPQATYSWYFNNAPIADQTQSTLVVDQTGTYTIKVEIPLSDSFCTIEDSIDIQLSSTQTAEPITDFELCDDTSANGTEQFNLRLKDPEILKGVPNGSYSISYHHTQEEAFSNNNAITSPIPGTTNPKAIFVRIEDTVNGCLAYSSFNIVVNASPVLPPMVTVCNDNSKDGFTTIDLQTDLDITKGDPDLAVFYFHNQSEAVSNDNAILEPYRISKTAQLYVRVENLITGCINEGNLTITVLESPVINTEDRHYIDACDTDHDGFATFDLTSVVDNVLNGSTGMTTRFFEMDDEGVEGNEILNPSNYSNTKANQQDVYIKVTNATGCSSKAIIELHTNALLTGTKIQEFSICDDQNGEKSFDLFNIEQTIANELLNISVHFYESTDDRSNNNSIDKTLPYTPPSFPHKLYITIDNTVCKEIAEIDLILNPIVDFPSIGDATYCDTDQDGITPIDFSVFDNAVTSGQTGYSVKYYLTEEDLKSNNPLSNLDSNTSNPQIIYTKTTSDKTGCSDIKSFTLTILPAPETNKASDIIICDDGETEFVINLNDKIDEIVEDMSDRAITFYKTEENAISKMDSISNPSNFDKKTQTVYARVDNTITGCHTIEPINIIVNTLPVIPAISVYKYCEDDSDGMGLFTFSTKDAEILNGQSGKRVFYYLDPIDAEQRNNKKAIDKKKPQSLTSRTIYVRVENITDVTCYATGSFLTEVGSNPKFNIPSDKFPCDFNNDGVESFDLNEIILEIKKGFSDDLQVSFYKDLSDAERGWNPLPLNENLSNPKGNTQLIYARITNNSLCTPVVSFNIGIIKPPQIKAPAQPLIKCDTYDNALGVKVDGIVEFNLQDAKVDIIDNRNVVLNYYEDEYGQLPILKPTAYASGSKTVYLWITNTDTGCHLEVPIELIVSLPETKSYETALCKNMGSIIIGPETNNEDDSYVWSTAQTTRQIEIDKIGIYSLRVTTTSGCSTTHVYNVIESEPATIDFTDHVDFSDPNNITVTISGIGNYMYQLNNKEPQESNVFENVPIGANLVTVIDLNGCGTTTKEIIVLDTPKFMTPNDDGYFDTWHITGVKTLPGTIVLIYDRYGKQLAQLTSTSPGWDGTFNGHKMPSTDYWFVADVKKDGTTFQLTGHFALKR
ncbi:T9SS type B sorting domain-containing protein [Gelidibacter salicanalis]|uniref:T9SS type B sorting domain-containing protein n=1 Tax=Gelidibacter salicanalis TaxID=291193 RepID=A0A934NGA8_9FLAO|nr:choice-of-anchor L domain-containing protein [Gelidibacter salicanalis]MBJ7879361.1 T9SS type B sorting domain-containing protein [Gelidibacter salicanalis]